MLPSFVLSCRCFVPKINSCVLVANEKYQALVFMEKKMRFQWSKIMTLRDTNSFGYIHHGGNIYSRSLISGDWTHYGVVTLYGNMTWCLTPLSHCLNQFDLLWNVIRGIHLRTSQQKVHINLICAYRNYSFKDYHRISQGDNMLSGIITITVTS